jgi:hypothetical protein
MKRARKIQLACALIFLCALAGFGARRWQQMRRYKFLSRPAPQAIWPWREARRSTPGAGLTRWQSRAHDGTRLELLRFDFAVNPNLKIGFYDQDEDDAQPLDNRVYYWQRGIWPVAQNLEHKLKRNNRELVALWNGSFFGLKNLQPRHRDYCFHVSPVVLNGKVAFNTSNHRWAWGFQTRNKKTRFKILHLPGRSALQNEFDFATGATQCLIRDGAPLQIKAFPVFGEKPPPQPVASLPREAGHIPFLDHMKTSRVSVAWTRDSAQLFLLFVKEPDGETPSRAALQKRVAAYGGWMLADVQRFWLSAARDLKIENAVALDGGDVAQLALRLRDNTIEIAPPRLAMPDLKSKATQRFEIPAARLSDTRFEVPAAISRGGSLMYFFVSDTQKEKP